MESILMNVKIKYLTDIKAIAVIDILVLYCLKNTNIEYRLGFGMVVFNHNSSDLGLALVVLYVSKSSNTFKPAPTT